MAGGRDATHSDYSRRDHDAPAMIECRGVVDIPPPCANTDRYGAPSNLVTGKLGDQPGIGTAEARHEGARQEWGCGPRHVFVNFQQPVRFLSSRLWGARPPRPNAGQETRPHIHPRPSAWQRPCTGPQLLLCLRNRGLGNARGSRGFRFWSICPYDEQPEVLCRGSGGPDAQFARLAVEKYIGLSMDSAGGTIRTMRARRGSPA